MGQKTMDDAEVQKKADFTLTDTGTCPGMRPKADKKNTSYVPSCTDSGVSKFIAVHPMRSLDAGKIATAQFPGETCMHYEVSACSMVSSSRRRHGVRFFFFCMRYDVFGVLHGQLVETPWSSLFFYMHTDEASQACSTIATLLQHVLLQS